MFARGLATRNSLRAFLLVSAALLGSLGQVKAEDVGLHFTGTTYGGTGTGGAAFNFTVNITSASFPTLNAPLYTYCISADTYLNTNDTYRLRDDIQNLPVPPGAMGVTAAVKIAILINELYGNGNENAGINFPTYNYGDVQNAIWYFIDVTNGVNNGLVSAVNTILTAQGTLAAYYTTVGSGGIQYIHGLDALGTGGSQVGQDQIYWNTTPPEPLVDVPVPAGVVLAGMGIAFIGGVNFLRRRKAVAAV